MRLLQWMVLTALKWPVIRALAADQLLPLMCIMSRCLYNLKESLLTCLQKFDSTRIDEA